MFCWAEFAEREDATVLHEGYATVDKYHWICSQCFQDFKEQFGWRVEAL